MYNKAQKEIFLTETKKIYSEAEKKYISSSINGNTVKKMYKRAQKQTILTENKKVYSESKKNITQKNN